MQYIPGGLVVQYRPGPNSARDRRRRELSLNRDHLRFGTVRLTDDILGLVANGVRARDRRAIACVNHAFHATMGRLTTVERQKARALAQKRTAERNAERAKWKTRLALAAGQLVGPRANTPPENVVVMVGGTDDVYEVRLAGNRDIVRWRTSLMELAKETCICALGSGEPCVVHSNEAHLSLKLSAPEERPPAPSVCGRTRLQARQQRLRST